MNATVTAPAFADRLPVKEPTLRDLALEAVAAATTFRSCRPSAPEWGEYDAAAVSAADRLRDGLARAGIDKPLLDALLSEGVIV